MTPYESPTDNNRSPFYKNIKKVLLLFIFLKQTNQTHTSSVWTQISPESMWLDERVGDDEDFFIDAIASCTAAKLYILIF